MHNGPQSDPRVGDRVSVEWPMEDESVRVLEAIITAVERSKKRKRENEFKYTLQFDDGDVQRTRLKHLKWEKIVSPPSSLVSSSRRKRPMPTHNRIVAPMVGGSELAFRLLCRRY